MSRIIIIGAASGMGREIAKQLHQSGHELALADINTQQLQNLSATLCSNVIFKTMDVSKHSIARAQLEEFINELGGVDIFIYTAGLADKSRIWKNEWKLHQVNAIGFAALSSYIYDYWRGNNQRGHIIGISSLLAVRGIRQAIAYCASKSFMRTYMQGLRHESISSRSGICITEIRPGFVDTAMTRSEENKFWIISAQRAANLILRAIRKKKKLAYVPGRWRLVSIFFRMIPEFVYGLKLPSICNRIYFRKSAVKQVA